MNIGLMDASAKPGWLEFLIKVSVDWTLVVVPFMMMRILPHAVLSSFKWSELDVHIHISVAKALLGGLSIH